MDKLVGHENAVPPRMIKRKIKIGDVAREIEVHYQGGTPSNFRRGGSDITQHAVKASYAGNRHNVTLFYHTIVRRIRANHGRHYLEGFSGCSKKTKRFRIIDDGEE